MATNDMVHGLRGWGVFFLLLFHHYTKSFPNGYVGADIIIVVSGFIAGYVLRNERIIDQKTIRDFCLKRAKSILPLYYLALFIILIFCYVLLPISYLQTNLEKSKTALLMISNIKLSCFENNFSVMLPSIEDAFGHTWLPCLLMQWYIVAPFLFWIQKRTTDKEFFFFAGVSACSFGFSLFSRKIITSYFIHCRLWQFCAGITAALYLPKARICFAIHLRIERAIIASPWNASYSGSVSSEDGSTGSIRETYVVLGNDTQGRSEKSESSSLHTDWMQYGRSFLNHPIFFLPLLIPMLWFRFPSFDLRLYITVATTLLLYAGHKNENFPFITNRLAVNLGKIFYPLYLTHWPIYILAKYHVGALHNDGIVKIAMRDQRVKTSVEVGIAVDFAITLFYQCYLKKLYTRMSSMTTRVLYALMIFSTVVLSMRTIEFVNEELHYISISFQDALYDILNAMF